MTPPALTSALLLCGLCSDVGNRARVNLAEFTPYFRAHFGPARGTDASGEGGWSGDSYRYEVLRRDEGPSLPPSFVIERRDGGGVYHYSAPLNHEAELWAAIAALPEPRRWDFCHLIAQAAEGCRAKGESEGTRKAMTAFAEGRMTKRKVRGENAYRVVIEPAAPVAVVAA